MRWRKERPDPCALGLRFQDTDKKKFNLSRQHTVLSAKVFFDTVAVVFVLYTVIGALSVSV